MTDNNRITIRHPRKREFFSKLALAGQTAQTVLGKTIDQYLEDTMFAIWHKDDSFTSTPEFSGTEHQVIQHWLASYDGNVSSLDHHIAPADPKRRNELWEIVGNKLEDRTPIEG